MITKTCFACGSPSVNILRSNNNWKTFHQFCSKCNKDQTAQVLKKRMSTLNSKKNIKISKQQTRNSLPKALLFGIVAAALSYNACIALAQSDGIENSVSYQATNTPFMSTYIHQDQIPVVAEKHIENIHDKITRYSLKYDIPRQELWQLVGCETSYKWNPEMQSDALYTFDDPKHGIVKGERERSYGLAMIHAPVHTELTLAQIKDADFALDWIGRHWGERKQLWKNCSQWHDL